MHDNKDGLKTGVRRRMLVEESGWILIPFAAILLLLSPAPVTADLAKTIFTISAGTLSIFLAVVAFVYSQFLEQIEDAHTGAAALAKKVNELNAEELKKQANDLTTQRDSLLSQADFPIQVTRLLFRLLILLFLSLGTSIVGYFASAPVGTLAAASSFLLFLVYLGYLLVRLVLQLLDKGTNFEGFVQRMVSEKLLLQPRPQDRERARA